MPIRPATTVGSKAVIGLTGDAGAGKTYNALLLARGMAGPTGKVVLIDTENRRGEIYSADPRIGAYDVLPLNEPFSAVRYMEALTEAENYGADVVIFDSMSHEWEGPGGVVDSASSISEARARRYNRDWNGEVTFADWKQPKIDHRKLVQRIMRSPSHLICCMRAQYKSRQIDKKDFAAHGIESKKNSEIIRDDFLSPIQEGGFIFEMMVQLVFDHNDPGVPQVRKCPDTLLPVFEPGKLITRMTGERIAAFYRDGAAADPTTAELIKRARLAANKGLEQYQTFFASIEGQERRALVAIGEHEAIKARFAEPKEPEIDDEQSSEDPPAEDPAPQTQGYVDPDFSKF